MKLTRKYTKAELKKWFNLYIRYRDSFEVEGGRVFRCCDCGNVYRFEQSHAGHYFPVSTHRGLEFEERNVHAQYFLHNCNKGYNQATTEKIKICYSNFMVKKYGADIIDLLQKQSRKPRQLKSYEIKYLIEFYKAKIKELK